MSKPFSEMTHEEKVANVWKHWDNPEIHRGKEHQEFMAQEVEKTLKMLNEAANETPHENL